MHISTAPVQTFRKWREDRKTDKEKQMAAAEAERKRKGVLTGREIFMEVSSASVRDIFLIAARACPQC